MSELRQILARIKDGENPSTVLASIEDPEKRKLYTYLLASQGKYKLVKPKIKCECSKCPLRKYCTFQLILDK